MAWDRWTFTLKGHVNPDATGTSYTATVGLTKPKVTPVSEGEPDEGADGYNSITPLFRVGFSFEIYLLTFADGSHDTTQRAKLERALAFPYRSIISVDGPYLAWIDPEDPETVVNFWEWLTAGGYYPVVFDSLSWEQDNEGNEIGNLQLTAAIRYPLPF